MREQDDLLNDRQAYFTRVLDDGRVIDVVPLTFGRARLCISQNMEDMGYMDGW